MSISDQGKRFCAEFEKKAATFDHLLEVQKTWNNDSLADYYPAETRTALLEEGQLQFQQLEQLDQPDDLHRLVCWQALEYPAQEGTLERKSTRLSKISDAFTL
jgi:hypothetical protein